MNPRIFLSQRFCRAPRLGGPPSGQRVRLRCRLRLSRERASGSPGIGFGIGVSSFSNSGKMSGRLLGCGVIHSCSGGGWEVVALRAAARKLGPASGSARYGDLVPRPLRAARAQ